MNGIYLLLGSNLGARLDQLTRAARLLMERGVQIEQQSSVYETEPWGVVEQPKFLNMVLKVLTDHSPAQLLKNCLEVEQEMGRKREIKWGARIIDIDILFYYNNILKYEDLTIPHPGIADRRFTLLPLCDIAPIESHPVTQETMQQLLDRLPDDQSCKRTALHLAL